MRSQLICVCMCIGCSMATIHASDNEESPIDFRGMVQLPSGANLPVQGSCDSTQQMSRRLSSQTDEDGIEMGQLRISPNQQAFVDVMIEQERQNAQEDEEEDGDAEIVFSPVYTKKAALRKPSQSFSPDILRAARAGGSYFFHDSSISRQGSSGYKEWRDSIDNETIDEEPEYSTGQRLSPSRRPSHMAKKDPVLQSVLRGSGPACLNPTPPSSTRSSPSRRPLKTTRRQELLNVEPPYEKDNTQANTAPRSKLLSASPSINVPRGGPKTKRAITLTPFQSPYDVNIPLMSNNRAHNKLSATTSSHLPYLHPSLQPDALPNSAPIDDLLTNKISRISSRPASKHTSVRLDTGLVVDNTGQEEDVDIYDDDSNAGSRIPTMRAPDRKTKLSLMLQSTQHVDYATWRYKKALPPNCKNIVLQTGSVVCFGGDGGISSCIRCCIGNYRNPLGISHAGIVLVARRQEMKEIIDFCYEFGSLNSNSDRDRVKSHMMHAIDIACLTDDPGLFLMHATGKYGVHIIPLLNYVIKYPGHVFVRNFEHPIPLYTLLERIKRNVGKKYHANVWHMFHALSNRNESSLDTKMFCSQLVADMLAAAGIFDNSDSVIPVNVTPAQLSSPCPEDILKDIAGDEIALKVKIRY